MSDDLPIYESAAEFARNGEPFVVMTVVKTQGSTPRDAGAKMIWRPGKGLSGTVGGGQFEHMVLDAAERFYQKRECGVEKYVLGADADQCCGGVMEVFFEFHGPRQRLVIFGAGHVSRSLADVLKEAPLAITVVDDRPDWNTAERFPIATRIGAWEEGVAAAQRHPDSTLACVMTCSHDTDFELLRKLLVRPPAFTGLIGSRSKRACLFGRLVASGIDEAVVQKVHCPIGLGDMGKSPSLVAVSMAGQILLEARKLAAL